MIFPVRVVCGILWFEVCLVYSARSYDNFEDRKEEGVGSWCAGHNPPFVFDGIQLNGLPASPAEITDAYLPFHPAGQPFHRIQPHPQRLNTHHPHPTIGRSVSAPEPRLSPHALTGATVQRGGRSFLRCQGHPKPSASSPTPKKTIPWSWR